MSLVIRFKPQEAAYIVKDGEIVGHMINIDNRACKFAFDGTSRESFEIIRVSLWEKLEAAKNGQEEKEEN